MFEQGLRTPVREVPGALAAVLMGFDGIPVHDVVAVRETYKGNLYRELATEYSAAVAKLCDASRTVSSDPLELQEVDLDFGNMKALFKILSEHYFVVLFLSGTANAGKGRYHLRLASSVLRAHL